MILAFSETTGRELWRLAPPRVQRCHLALQGHRALVGTDSGYLYGLDLLDGQVRFRMKANMAFAAPTVPWGRRLIGVLSEGRKVAVFVADAHHGNVQWAREVAFDQPSNPVGAQGKVFVAGEQAGEGVLLCLNPKGEPHWERQLHLGHGPYRLTACGRAVVVTNPSGGAVWVEPDGRIEWRLGDAGEALPEPLAASLSRGVLFVPGERIRAVDPRGGRVLAEVAPGGPLRALQADAALRLYALTEEGSLKAYRLASHLAVVGEPEEK